MTMVGIMSMQRILNYGSSLQAYGLKQIIEGLDDGNQVSFLDFVPGEVLVTNLDPGSTASAAKRTFTKIREYNQVNTSLSNRLRFFEHKRSYAKKYFSSLGIPVQPNFDRAVDVQVIGSDEVFNCVQANSNVGFSRDLFAHGTAAKRVISYAASFGNTSLDAIQRVGIRTELENYLSRFAAISVRDENSAAIVSELTGVPPLLHVDPVLAYDFERQATKAPAGRPYRRPYLIAYGYGGRFTDEENSAVTRYARSRGYDVVCLGGVQSCCDRFVDCSPMELLAYFRHADAVVTDTYHGTIFAIINRRAFATIVRPTVLGGYGNEEKLGSLFRRLGLQTRRARRSTDLGEILDVPIEYERVFEEIQVERQRSTDFLSHHIVGGAQ